MNDVVSNHSPPEPNETLITLSNRHAPPVLPLNWVLNRSPSRAKCVHLLWLLHVPQMFKKGNIRQIILLVVTRIYSACNLGFSLIRGQEFQRINRCDASARNLTGRPGSVAMVKTPSILRIWPPLSASYISLLKHVYARFLQSRTHRPAGTGGGIRVLSGGPVLR